MTSANESPDVAPDVTTDEILQAFARDVELLLTTLPPASSDTLVENPHRELDPIETEMLADMPHALDPARDNRYLRSEYAEFIQLAVTVDTSAREAQDRARTVLEALSEQDGIALVQQPFQTLTAEQAAAIDALGDETLLRANADGQQLAEDIAIFLDRNVTIAEDDEG
ncbi:hypothetical protein [Demequina aestuarii]|uniref:hypothetical protein n=1 Tax=Demequina aestuarii TaxID=327095 RepID=UPI0007823BD5|nr:hypothetical protein [Demequina aestuarii]